MTTKIEALTSLFEKAVDPTTPVRVANRAALDFVKGIAIAGLWPPKEVVTPSASTTKGGPLDKGQRMKARKKGNCNECLAEIREGEYMHYRSDFGCTCVICAAKAA